VGECWGRVTDCSATANVSGYKHVGGLIGSNYANLQNCFAAGHVTADANSAGGLVGLNIGMDGAITACYSTGNVQAKNSVGGLVGYSSGSTISLSYSMSRVYGQNNVGGLVGTANTAIQSSYARGEVQGHDFVGGLVGIGTDPVVECYSTGQVSGTRYVGGLIGRAWYREAESCLWDIETSRQQKGEGYQSHALEGIVGKTTSEMQTASSFIDAGWDFAGESDNGTEDVWRILEGRTYPTLSWEPLVNSIE
jgi:hypothetical protein